MSKRKRNKRKQKSNAASSQSRESPVSRKIESKTSGVAVERSTRRQGPLLWLALVLLVATVGINVYRWSNTGEPAALPLPDQPLISSPLAAPSQPTGDTQFTLLSPSETGVDFVHPVIPDHPQAYLYFSSPASGGTAIGDVNNDGRPDIFVASGPEKNRLYIQTETPLKFEDASRAAGIEGGDRWACGATMVDINADGRLDIYVANYDAPCQLFINRGDGTFVDKSYEYGVNFTDACLEGAFADYDRDGDLDLYVLMYRYENPEGMPKTPPIVGVPGKRSIHPDSEKFYEVTNDSIGYGTYGRWDYLLRNNGNGTFSNATIKAGIVGRGHGQSVMWWDFDRDGWIDIHVGNDFNDPDRLYRNNRDGTFTDVVRESAPHISWFSMGSDVGDINGDGFPDLLSADMSSTTHFKQKTTMGAMGDSAEFLSKAVPRQYMRNALLLGTDVGRFREAAYLTGLDSTDWTWAVKLVDFDCDGQLDAYFTNGSVRSFTDSDMSLKLSERVGKTEWDIYKHTEPLREQNLAFRNVDKASLKFEDVSKSWGLDHTGVSMAAAHGDLDGDGDLDLVVSNLDEPMSIYRNDSIGNRRLTLSLHAQGKNRNAVGAKVVVSYAGKAQAAELQPTRGFLSSNQPILHFGCGEAEVVDLAITWPDGTYQELSSLATNHHHEITQPADLPPAPLLTSNHSSFRRIEVPAGLAHKENDFDDYQLQSLLPHRMSRLGPALAVGDANGDGKFDVFVGGASGQPGRVALGGDQLTISPQAALEADAQCEDMGAVWLDFDQDGDVDLFVASGGNESAVGAENYRPRLYRNDGKGNLESTSDVLPSINVSAGPVAAADFDGDVDLFLGGRQVPGQYPLPPDSFLLLNENGKFIDGTQAVFGVDATLGMVTGAIWSDVDNDRDLDLLVTNEWDSIKLYRNETSDGEGRLVDDSAAAGLTAYRGWWTGINGGDFDGDGDIDFVATNMGLNSKYHASDEKPFAIYYGDFEGDGQRKLVEAEYEAETLFPVRGKSCSTHAMPSLAQKFETYKDFAAASLQEIYTPECLDEAYQCSANYLESAMLVNDGQGRFRVESLPREAQISPGFGTVVLGKDIFMAQNFFSPQPETGNMDGGLGCYLKRGADGFVPDSNSGIAVSGDAMAASVIDVSDKQLAVLVSTNDGLVRGFATPLTNRRILKLEGVKSRSEIAGIRIRLEVAGKQIPVEPYSGSGYLTQAPPLFVLPIEAGEDAVLRISVGDREIEKPISKVGPSVSVVSLD